ncbi:MAG: AcrR family transcriptional regulator [Halioglobus sp.]|jgi:AcrR family transcriptional regulator
MTTCKNSKRDRILDTAEELFALHRYDGVSLRKIATGAVVDVALANYHFGGKLDLFNAVFERRAALLNESRRQTLRDSQSKAGKKGPSVEQIIELFLRPLEMTQDTAGFGEVCRQRPSKSKSKRTM